MRRRSLDGRVTLITGAATGIGAAAARALVARGGRVALAGLEPDRLAALATDLGAARALAVEADVTDADALDRAVAATVDRFGGVDALVANAGIVALGPIGHEDPLTFGRVIDVNLLGMWRAARACLPQLVERDGYALFVASLAAVMPIPGAAAYNASKSGTVSLANTLRLETAHLGVNVGVAYFGFVDTEMIAAIDQRAGFRAFEARLPAPFRARISAEAAGEAIARGVERRSRRVVAPARIRPVLRVGRALTPLVALHARRWMGDVLRRHDEEASRRGGVAVLATTTAPGDRETLLAGETATP